MPTIEPFPKETNTHTHTLKHRKTRGVKPSVWTVRSQKIEQFIIGGLIGHCSWGKNQWKIIVQCSTHSSYIIGRKCKGNMCLSDFTVVSLMYPMISICQDRMRFYQVACGWWNQNIPVSPRIVIYTPWRCKELRLQFAKIGDNWTALHCTPLPSEGRAPSPMLAFTPRIKLPGRGPGTQKDWLDSWTQGGWDRSVCIYIYIYMQLFRGLRVYIYI